MREQVIKNLIGAGVEKELAVSLIEVPKNSELGDYSFPCFQLSKTYKKSPQEIAKEIVLKIKNSGEFEKIEVVGGYINFFLDKKRLANEILGKIIKEGKNYGKYKVKKRKVMVEFSQPNTHKAFHIGHIRGTSYGESISRIMEFCGDKVIRANYSGDTGMHIAKWIWCYNKFHKNEKISEEESWIAGIYVEAVKKLSENKEFEEEVKEINLKLSNKSDEKINKLWKETRKLSIDSWKKIYEELETKFDLHYFESEVEDEGKKISEELVKKGIAEISEDATIVNLESCNLGVWVLLRKDGTVLYSAKDLALAKRKFEEHKLDYSIIETGNEQDLHFKQLIKTLELMKLKNWNNYKHLSHGMIRLPTGKMSSRTGDNILYSEFKEELLSFALKEIKSRFPELSEEELEKRALKISISAMKYSMLKQDNNKNIIFDKTEALKFEGDTGPYILYTYARANSIIEKTKKSEKLIIAEDISEQEKKLINELAKFPEVVEGAYKNFAPNLIANYSFELSQIFNEFYHSCKVIGSDKEQFRLVLVKSFLQVIENSTKLLGITLIEKM